MINNIIRITRQEMDRLKLITEKKGYIAATFNIATQDRFPLHEIHYVFDNINPGEIYEIDTTIKSEFAFHVFKNVVYFKGRCVGVVSVTMKDYDPVNLDWGSAFKVMAIQRGREQWLKEVGLMVVTTTMMVSFAMLYPEKVFEKEPSGKHRLKAATSKSDSDEIIYSKLNALVSVSHPSTQPTGKGSCPQHEFDVRGHMRRYKSGKVVYIKPYTKCKGRGTKIIHEYSMKEVHNNE